jgi:hypothetical protein
MSNYPDGMTRADLIHVGEIDDPQDPKEYTVTLVLYVQAPSEDEATDDEWLIAAIQSGSMDVAGVELS